MDKEIKIVKGNLLPNSVAFIIVLLLPFSVLLLPWGGVYRVLPFTGLPSSWSREVLVGASFLIAILVSLTWGMLGSYVATVQDRLRTKSKVLDIDVKSLNYKTEASHCFNCNTIIEKSDLVPVISYIKNRGRCKYCNTPIPKKYLVLELVFTLIGFFLTVSFIPLFEVVR